MLDTFQAGPARLVIDRATGARIHSLTLFGYELLVAPSNDPIAWGSYPMAPWAGRVRRGLFHFEGNDYHLPVNFPPHAMHGTTYDRPWQRDDDGYTIDLGPAWPFDGFARQQFTLTESRLELRLEVHSRDTAFPASIGWHPWFRRELGTGGPLELDFQAQTMLTKDDDYITTRKKTAPGQGPWDDCFTGVTQPVTLRWPGAVVLTMRADSDTWVVYNGPAHALCVEPQSAPPNALNDWPQVVTPERPLALTSVWAWRRDDPPTTA